MGKIQKKGGFSMIQEANHGVLHDTAAKLFSGWEETMITSCLQGEMGKIYTDGDSAAAFLGDIAFYAGKPSQALVRFHPEQNRHFLIMVPGDDAWEREIESCYPDCKKVSRYAFRKDTAFDRKKLEALTKQLPEGYSRKLIDEEIFQWSRQQDWCRDWVSQFESYDDYAKRGLGVVILKDGLPVSGASSYSVYREGIEIEIQTLPAHRRKGLATCAAASLILECLNRGLYPSWDAANLWSVGLAKKLGYAFSHEYTAYHVQR